MYEEEYIFKEFLKKILYLLHRDEDPDPVEFYAYLLKI